jgi:two-component system, LytTR family, sensor kinase
MEPVCELSLKQRLAMRMTRRSLIELFLINCAITAFLMIFSRPRHWNELIVYLSITFIFAQSIGFCCHFLLHRSDALAIRRPWKRWSFFVLMLLAAGVAGTLIALLALKAINSPFFRSNYDLPSLFITNSILAFCFGGVFGVIKILRRRLQETAALLAEKEVQEQKLLQLKTRSELEALRSRVNPHFLFNTLNSIASLVVTDPMRAEEMIQKLARMFRYVLDSADRHQVRLEEELAIVRDYLEIEKIRLADRLNYRITMAPEMEDFSVPALLLQPLVENSIKHGIAPRQSGGEVKIDCLMTEEHGVIEVRDNGRGFSPEAGSQGFGLRGVRERLDLLYGDRHQFNIIEDGGVCVRIELPRNIAPQEPCAIEP